MGKYKGKTHLVIPDVQVRPGVNTEHLTHVGNYIAAKRPDVIICLGDFADLPSLSSYSLGKADAEGRRYVKDIRAVHEAMENLVNPFSHLKDYNPRMVLTLGNHEARILTEAAINPRFEGAIRLADLQYEQAGWDVYPFLKVVRIDGIEYSHYFTSGAMGRPVSSAAALLKIRQSSAVMGHTQQTDIAIHPRTGKIGIFAGLCNTHNEKYLTPQGNSCRRQLVVLHEVHNGIADPMLVSLDFLRKKYS